MRSLSLVRIVDNHSVLQGITVRKEGENLIIARIITGTMIERQGDAHKLHPIHSDVCLHGCLKTEMSFFSEKTFHLGFLVGKHVTFDQISSKK